MKNWDNQLIFNNLTFTTEQVTNHLYYALVLAAGLKREVRIVIADFIEPEKNTQARKVFFSTDENMEAVDIFDIYRTKFQNEFLYRDAKHSSRGCATASRETRRHFCCVRAAA